MNKIFVFSLFGIFIFQVFSFLIFAQASFQGLGDLSGGIFRSSAFGVADDSTIVVGWGTTENGQEAYRSTTNGGMVGLGELSGGNFFSEAEEISADGLVVVGSSDGGNGIEAFRWTESDGMVGLGDLPGGNFSSIAYSISSDGLTIVGGGTSNTTGKEAFRWTESGGMIGLGSLPGGNPNSLARSVSSDGLVIVGTAISSDGPEAFLWTENGGMVGLGDLTGGNFFSSAYDVSSDGSFIVGSGTSENGIEAFIWTEGNGMVGLGDLPGGNFNSVAYSISADGSTVVGSGASGNGTEAFIWTEANGMRNLKQVLENDYGLDLTGWMLIDCRDVSKNGQMLIGTGINPNGDTEAWLAVLPSALVAWNNIQGGNFSVGSNWVGGVVPDDNQIALFDSSYYTSPEQSPKGGQPITVTFSDITTTNGLTIGSSQVIFDLQSHSYGVNNLRFDGPPSLPDESQLEIVNGVLGTTGEVGIGTDGSVGQMIISTNGIFEFSPGSASIFYVGKGNCGSGECGRLIIQNGGQVYTNENENGFSAIGVNEAEGSVFISGLSSKWQDYTIVSIGSDGTGLLEISDKAEFVANTVWLAETDISEGILNVSGASTGFIIQGDLIAGIQGNAEINLSSGAVAFLGRTILGSESGSNGEITITDTSSTFYITNDTLFIGHRGSGGISILNGGEFQCRETLVPGDVGGIGSALVDGENSKWLIETTLRLGYEGVGFIRLTNMGVLDVGIVQVGPLGTIEHSGGNLYVGGNPVLLSTEFLSDTSGAAYVDTLLVSEGAQILADSVIFGEGGYLGGEGNFTFDVINSGGLNPGDSIYTPGLFTIDANYTQLSNGTLFIELEGDLPGSGFDQLAVNGNAQIAGTLDVSALNIYEPTIGQTFEIVTANNITGTFDNIIGHRGLDVSVTYNSTNIIITITSPVSVEDDNNLNTIPTKYSLAQNYPNPFNPGTNIQFSLPQSSFVTLEVFNTLGERVVVLASEELSAGTYNYNWDASGFTSGIYFYKIQAGSFIQTKKMILLR